MECDTFDRFMNHLISLRQKRLECIKSGPIDKLIDISIDKYCDSDNRSYCLLCREKDRLFGNGPLMMFHGSYCGKEFFFKKIHGAKPGIVSIQNQIYLDSFILEMLGNDVFNSSVYSWICRKYGYQVITNKGNTLSELQKYPDLLRPLENTNPIEKSVPLKYSTIYDYLGGMVELLNKPNVSWGPMTQSNLSYTPVMKQYKGKKYIIFSRITIVLSIPKYTSFQVNDRLFFPEMSGERNINSQSLLSSNLVIYNNTWMIVLADSTYRSLILGRIPWNVSRDITGLILLMSLMSEYTFGVSFLNDPSMLLFLRSLVIEKDADKFLQLIRDSWTKKEIKNPRDIMMEIQDITFNQGFYDILINHLEQIYPTP